MTSKIQDSQNKFQQVHLLYYWGEREVWGLYIDMHECPGLHKTGIRGIQDTSFMQDTRQIIGGVTNDKNLT